MSQDMLFDLAELERQAVAATDWDGACPLRYTTDYYTPAEYDAAYARWQARYGHFGSLVFSHMWHRSLCNEPLLLPQHHIHLYGASAFCDLRPYGVGCPGRDEADHDHTNEPLPGQYMHQANCPPCRWHRIDHDERIVVEAWHDHAMPGWRQLPVLPATLARNQGETKGEARILDWAATHYPTTWQIPGAPILTERSSNARRPVPGRSPFGGYDLAHTMEAAPMEGTRP